MTSFQNNENNPNISLPIKQEPEIKKMDTEEEDINTSMNPDEATLLKEKITLLNSDKNEILKKLETYLSNINLNKDIIESIASFICDKIYKYRNLLCEEIFNMIFSFNHAEPKLEFLCIINEILKSKLGVENNEPHCEIILKILKKKIFPYAKGVCLDLFQTMHPPYMDNVNYFLNEWEKNNFLDNEYIKEIKFELKFWNEPNITGSDKDMKYLMNLVNFGNFRIEQSLIDYSRAMESLNRNKDNFQRKKVLKLQKDLIQKQLRIYNSHVQQLKEINLLLNKIKEYPELFEN